MLRLLSWNVSAVNENSNSNKPVTERARVETDAGQSGTQPCRAARPQGVRSSSPKLRSNWLEPASSNVGTGSSVTLQPRAANRAGQHPRVVGASRERNDDSNGPEYSRPNGRGRQPRMGRPRSRSIGVNVTDCDSRLMKTQGGWVQGFNAQAAVTDAGIVVAADVTRDPFDVGQCQPMIRAVETTLAAAGVTDTIGMMLFDAGYLSEANITAPGPSRLIATGKAWTLKRENPTSGEPPAGLTPIAAMEHRLRTPDGAALYAKRQQHRRTGLRDHQRDPRLPALHQTRTRRRQSRMAPHHHRPQHQQAPPPRPLTAPGRARARNPGSPTHDPAVTTGFRNSLLGVTEVTQKGH